MIGPLNCPDIDFLGNNTPVCMIIVGANNVQILNIFLYDMVNFPFPEDMIVTVMGHGASSLRRVLGVTGAERIVIHVGIVVVMRRISEQFLFKGGGAPLNTGGLLKACVWCEAGKCSNTTSVQLSIIILPIMTTIT